MSMEYVRKTYGVPAKRGGRVLYTGDHSGARYGTITGASHRIRVRFDGFKFSLPLHPTWMVEYLT